MSENNQAPELQVTNPLQAASEIFYKPRGVFDALAVKDNWSWIAFAIIAVVMFLPPVFYFSLVDFEWWKNATFATAMEDMAPAEIDALMAQTQLGLTKWSTAIGTVIGMVVWFLIVAFYFSLVTKNDEKSVQGFTDWYGAMWWISMPMVVNSLVALLIISMQTAGSEIAQGVLSPLSLAYILNVEMASPWFNLLTSVSLPALWSIWLGKICVQAWTQFSANKCLLISAIPSLIVWSLSLVFIII